MIRYVDLAVVLYLASILQFGDGYRILGVFPSPHISHQVVFRGLTLALNKRGHELVVVTANPVNDPTLTNYTEIDISFMYGLFSNANYVENRGKFTFMDIVLQASESVMNYGERILSQPDLLKLYAPHSNEKFDLLLVETIGFDCIYPLATRFGVPMIGISSMATNIYVHHGIGNPILSHSLSHPELETEISENPSFWQRLRHFFIIWRFLYSYRTTWLSKQAALARKYFGSDIPCLNDLAKNMSLVLINQQRAISAVRPNVPKVIEIGGFHLSKKPANLSKELAIFLDEATEGFVYMNLGSNAKSTMMPKKTLEQFIIAFSRLPYKVLWKFENDDLPGKPDNVHIMKWVPQQTVLAHRNLKVFVYQGGVQSTEEAVHNAVPLIAIPIFGDQDMQVVKMVSLGVARKLEIRTLNAYELFEAISTVASDVRYKQKMLNLRSLMKDTPYDLLENAMWWIEHVIRHRGAPHLHSTTADEPWYSRQDMDIVAFITVGFVIVSGLTCIALHFSLKRVYNICFVRTLDTKKID